MSEDSDACKLCGKPLGMHGLNSDCGMFLSSKPGAAEQERAAIVKWLRRREQEERDYARKASLRLRNVDPRPSEARAFAYRCAFEAFERLDHLNEGDK